MNNTVKIEGLRELEKQLTDLGDALTAQKIVQQALRDSAKPMHEAAKSKAPVAAAEYDKYISAKNGESIKKTYQPGHIAEKIVLKKWINRSSATEIAGLLLVVRRSAWWAVFFERGGPHTPKQPFMGPAFDEQNGAVVNTFADKLRARIQKVIAKRSKSK